MTRATAPESRRDGAGAVLSDSLAAGAAGIALLHIERARSGVGRWDTAHQWVRTMVGSPVHARAEGCSLYKGAPAVAFVLHAAARPVYAPVLATLDDHVTSITRQRLALAHERIDRGRLPARREFDLVSGMSGLGVYLLHRYGGGDLLEDVLTYLVRLTQPVTIRGEALPGWWCPEAPDGRPSPNWPGGHGNIGLAHGITGPLALLATTLRRDVAVHEQTDAVLRISAWLDHWRCGNDSRPWWPAIVTLPECRSSTVRKPGPSRPSWCYGTPGIARALQLAALALNDRRRQAEAELALARCVTDDEQLSQIGDASLCHGWAGLLLATWRVACDAVHDTELGDRLPDLHARMNRHIDQHGPPPEEGLLEGTAGVQLVLDTVTTARPPTSGWDACLLLDGGEPAATTPDNNPRRETGLR